MKNNLTISENLLTVSRTARYYTLGQASENTRYIWVVCHGYGQLAASFIKNFTHIASDRHFIVAPEGLSRFYWNGFGGKPVAAWMTSEAREHEISDYIQYLDSLYIHIRTQFRPEQPIGLIGLGFSQGATTLSRWLSLGHTTTDTAIFWAGNIAHDLDWERARRVWHSTRLWAVYGTEDEFIQPQMVEEQQRLLLNNGILHVRPLTFAGRHELNETILSQLATEIAGN